MKIVIAAIGRLKIGGERDLFDRYTGRFDQSGRGLGLGQIELRELPESRRPDAPERKTDEAKRLLAVAPAGASLISLDERGRQMASEAFAHYLAALRDNGTQAAAFLIGGPDGHGEDALAAAPLRLSLSAMTLPHGLARVVLAEQLYRAAMILAGHPYHRS